MKPNSPEQLRSFLFKYGKPLSTFKKGSSIHAGGGYTYTLAEEPGALPPDFQTELSPAEMLMLGVFEGAYLNDCYREFPAEWFLGGLMMGTLSPRNPNPAVNLFGVKSRQPLSVWRENGWVTGLEPILGKSRRPILASSESNPDDRGWFQWYCRFWMGRRIPDLDKVQIGRWHSFTRHAGAIRANCKKGDLLCRPRERQALLQWAWSPFV